MRDNEIVASEEKDISFGNTYNVRTYKCGCKRATRLADDGTETSAGFSSECTSCHYGSAGLPD